jgi:hypothetical protein
MPNMLWMVTNVNDVVTLWKTDITSSSAVLAAQSSGESRA